MTSGYDKNLQMTCHMQCSQHTIFNKIRRKELMLCNLIQMSHPCLFGILRNMQHFNEEYTRS